jgi:hypothetical protein
MNDSLFLIESPKTFRYWWTFIPALPLSRDSQNYRALRRHWADHTMNTLVRKDGILMPGPRSAYVPGREDHLTPVLFNIWAAIPSAITGRFLLDLLLVPHSEVTALQIGYSWEQKRSLKRRPDVTDIVVAWRDDDGDGVVVIEAKRKGGKLQGKDLAGGASYMDLPSIRPFARKHMVFLVDEQDAASTQGRLPLASRIVSWQEMGKAQSTAALSLGLPASESAFLQALIARHYEDMDAGFDPKMAGSVPDTFAGNEATYEAIRAKGLPQTIEAFLLGSAATLSARKGIMPDPPFDWLRSEPALDDLAALRQPTSEREYPYWRLPPLKA